MLHCGNANFYEGMYDYFPGETNALKTTKQMGSGLIFVAGFPKSFEIIKWYLCFA